MKNEEKLAWQATLPLKPKSTSSWRAGDLDKTDLRADYLGLFGC